ncbi:hypothetical protein [Fictibacillus sp. WQ 8-8]|nr:hypothetical protein [Fictibacillus sp. WQ 8-8]
MSIPRNLFLSSNKLSDRLEADTMKDRVDVKHEDVNEVEEIG